jgi:hypothetical protein
MSGPFDKGIPSAFRPGRKLTIKILDPDNPDIPGCAICGLIPTDWDKKATKGPVLYGLEGTPAESLDFFCGPCFQAEWSATNE